MGGVDGLLSQGTAPGAPLSAARARARSARQTLQFQTVQHQPTTTDCQPTLNNGIIVFVTGKLAVQPFPRPHTPRKSAPPLAPALTPRSPLPTPALLTCAQSSSRRRPSPRRQQRRAACLQSHLGPRCDSPQLSLPRTGRRRYQPVDVFAGARSRHTLGAPQTVHTHTRAPVSRVFCALISDESPRARSRSCSSRPPGEAGTSTTISSA